MKRIAPIASRVKTEHESIFQEKMFVMVGWIAILVGMKTKPRVPTVSSAPP